MVWLVAPGRCDLWVSSVICGSVGGNESASSCLHRSVYVRVCDPPEEAAVNRSLSAAGDTLLPLTFPCLWTWEGQGPWSAPGRKPWGILDKTMVGIFVGNFSRTEYWIESTGLQTFLLRFLRRYWFIRLIFVKYMFVITAQSSVCSGPVTSLSPCSLICTWPSCLPWRASGWKDSNCMFV